MRKLKLYIAQSIDGFIATEKGSVEWLNDNENEEIDENAYGYLDFYSSIDTTLMGYNTYKEIVNFGIPFPYPDKKNYVFSKNHEKKEDNPVEFIKSNIVEFVSNLKQLDEKDIWLIGGGEINKILLNKNLIDEIIITIKSVVLGKGIPLFANGTDFKKFKITKVEKFDDSFAQIIMERK
ncbi:MAG: dihydrofolate reductase [Bacteroidales bacterium]|nr:dihydrofolate reductase [Bacteroidales bacterium]